MTVTYSSAPEVKKIAEDLIPKHHEHLEQVQIEYVFRSEAAKEAGKTILGKARKVGGLNAFLLANEREELDDEETVTFFVIEIARDAWSGLTKAQRTGLVDHELTHCRTKYNDEGDLTLYVAPHDLEEFHAVVERHGLWQRDVEIFVNVANHQLTLLEGNAS